MEMSSNIVGKNIRSLREKAGFTQSNLAQYMGVDESFITRIEAGEDNLSANQLEKFATLFCITTDKLEEPCAFSNFSVAFKKNKLTVKEMEAVAAVNRIALNAEFLSSLLSKQI